MLYSTTVNANLEQLVTEAANQNKIPSWVLKSVCTHESQSFFKGKRQAWPWTLNIDGKGIWFKSENAAVTYAELSLQNGSRNIDIGLCQISWRWHGHRFNSIRQLINPLNNLLYAAEILANSKGEQSWNHAIGAYHSPSNVEKAKQYSELVLQYQD